MIRILNKFMKAEWFNINKLPVILKIILFFFSTIMFYIHAEFVLVGFYILLFTTLPITAVLEVSCMLIFFVFFLIIWINVLKNIGQEIYDSIDIPEYKKYR